MDDTRTYRVDANASCGVVERRAFCEPQHAVLRGLVCSAFGAGDQSADRRAVDDCTTTLLEHLAKLELHATPHSAQIDRNHPVKVFPCRFGGLRNDILDAGIVVGGIQPAESSDGPFDHRFHLSVVGYVAWNSECLVSADGQLLRRSTYGLFVRVGQCHQSARLREGRRRRKPQPGSRPSDESNLVFKRYVHNRSSIGSAKWNRKTNVDAFRTHPSQPALPKRCWASRHRRPVARWP